MQKKTLAFILLSSCSIGLFFLGGCASTPAPRFYTLDRLSGAEQAMAMRPLNQGPTLGLGPIRFPDYLQNTGIVTRTGRNTIEIAEFDLWVGDLKEDFMRILYGNLSYLMHTHKIALFPYTGSVSVDIRILLTVSRFEGTLGGDAVLEATWMVMEAQDKKEGVIQRSYIVEPVNGSDYSSLVAAQSRTVGKLSREIAQAIQSLPTPAAAK